MNGRMNKIINISLLACILASGISAPVSAKMSSAAHQYYEAACRAEAAQNYLQAIEQMKQALIEAPDDALLYTKLAGLYSEIGDWQNSLSMFKKAIKLRPNDAFIYISVGNILQQQHNYDDAFSAYYQALTIFPDYTYNYLNMANVKYLMGDKQEALDYGEKVFNFINENIKLLKLNFKKEIEKYISDNLKRIGQQAAKRNIKYATICLGTLISTISESNTYEHKSFEEILNTHLYYANKEKNHFDSLKHNFP